MCLKLSGPAKPRTATRDIRVVKYLRDDIQPISDHPVSIYRHEPYPLGKLKRVEAFEWDVACRRAAAGEDIEGGGLHSLAERADEDGTAYRAIIPKGAKYFVGIFFGTKSYVSNKLIVQRPMNSRRRRVHA